MNEQKIVQQTVKAIYNLGQIYNTLNDKKTMNIIQQTYIQGIADGIMLSKDIINENDKEYQEYLADNQKESEATGN